MNMLYALLSFIRHFVCEFWRAKEIHSRIVHALREVMEMNQSVSTHNGAEGTDVLIRKGIRNKLQILVGITAMRSLFQKKRTARDEIGSECFMLMCLYIHTISDLLEGRPLGMSARETRAIVDNSVLLRIVLRRIFFLLHKRKASASALHTVETCIGELHAHYIDGACMYTLPCSRETRSVHWKRREQKRCLIVTSLWYMLYPTEVPDDEHIGKLSALFARAMMSSDIKNAYQDILFENYGSVVCLKLLAFPLENQVLLQRAEYCSSTEMSPWKLKSFAPCTYSALHKQFDRLGNVVVTDTNNSAYRLLRLLGDMLFFGYPIFRTCIHCIVSRRVM